MLWRRFKSGWARITLLGCSAVVSGLVLTVLVSALRFGPADAAQMVKIGMRGLVDAVASRGKTFTAAAARARWELIPGLRLSEADRRQIRDAALREAIAQDSKIYPEIPYALLIDEPAHGPGPELDGLVSVGEDDLQALANELDDVEYLRVGPIGYSLSKVDIHVYKTIRVSKDRADQAVILCCWGLDLACAEARGSWHCEVTKGMCY